MRNRSNLRIISVVFGLGMGAGIRAGAQAPDLQPGPGYTPRDFRVTTFAQGLRFPLSMQRLADGSLLVGVSNPTGGSFFASTGELARLVDADGDGVADGPATILYTGLPGMVTSVRQAGTLVLVTSAGTRITVLRQGQRPSDPLTFVSSLNFTFPNNWEHTTYTLAVRPVAGQTAQYEVVFNVGSQENFAVSTGTVKLSGLLTATLQGESLYKFLLKDFGDHVTASNLTHIATGLRNAAGILFHPQTGDLYFTDNGIDGLQDPNEPLSADELNRIAAADIGGSVENFGFPSDYIEYRTGKHVGSGGVQPLIAFQPLPDPMTGSESEGPNEITLAPTGFPPALRNGIFIGFHGKFGQAGIENEENPLVYCDPEQRSYFQIIGNDEPNVGHLDGLLATTDSLFVADWSVHGSYGNTDTGAIYQIKYYPATNVKVADVTGAFGQTVSLSATLRRTTGNVPQSGRTLTFQIGSKLLGTAKTNSGGVATRRYKIPTTLSAGDHALTVTFPDGTINRGSTGDGILHIDRADTSLMVSNVTGASGQTVPLTATLRRVTDNALLADKALTFKVAGKTVGSARTDSNGIATFRYPIPSTLGTGDKTVSVVFPTGSFHNGSSGSGTLTITP